MSAAGHKATTAAGVKIAADARVRTIATDRDFTTALADVRPGDVLELASGSHTDLRLVIPASIGGNLNDPSLCVRRPAGTTSITGGTVIRLAG